MLAFRGKLPSKKNLVLLLVVFVLGAGVAYWFIIRDKAPRTHDGTDYSQADYSSLTTEQQQEVQNATQPFSTTLTPEESTKALYEGALVVLKQKTVYTKADVPYLFNAAVGAYGLQKTAEAKKYAQEYLKLTEKIQGFKEYYPREVAEMERLAAL